MTFNFKKYAEREALDYLSFVWSEARLVIASLALFLGGRPPAIALNPLPFLYGIVSLLLWLSWIVSGLVSVYLLIRWNQNKRMIFGKNDKKTTYAFFVNIISGLNLGVAGFLGQNLGMRISSNYSVFIVVGVVYLISAYILFRGWKSNKEKVF